jgi:hypothetical protein
MVKPPTKFTPAKQAAYLAALEETGEVSSSAALVKVSRQCVYDRMKADPEFLTACEEAQGRLDARIMATVRKLAVEGTTVYTYGKDGKVATEKRVFSERVLLAWLKARHRERWGDKVEVDQNVHGTVVSEQRIRVEDMSPEQLRAARAFVATLPEGPSMEGA